MRVVRTSTRLGSWPLGLMGRKGGRIYARSAGGGKTRFRAPDADALRGVEGGGQVTAVPDSSSTALLLGIALVSSLLVGRKLIKK